MHAKLLATYVLLRALRPQHAVLFFPGIRYSSTPKGLSGELVNSILFFSFSFSLVVRKGCWTYCSVGLLHERNIGFGFYLATLFFLPFYTRVPGYLIVP